MKGQGRETKESGKGTRHDGRRNKYRREKRKDGGGGSLKYHIMSNPPVRPNHSLLLVSQERKCKPACAADLHQRMLLWNVSPLFKVQTRWI